MAELEGAEKLPSDEPTVVPTASQAPTSQGKYFIGDFLFYFILWYLMWESVTLPI